MEKLAISVSKCAASVRIARLLAFKPPITSIAMKIRYKLINPHSFFADFDRCTDSVELITCLKKGQLATQCEPSDDGRRLSSLKTFPISISEWSSVPG